MTHVALKTGQGAMQAPLFAAGTPHYGCITAAYDGFLVPGEMQGAPGSAAWDGPFLVHAICGALTLNTEPHVIMIPNSDTMNRCLHPGLHQFKPPAPPLSSHHTFV